MSIETGKKGKKRRYIPMHRSWIMHYEGMGNPKGEIGEAITTFDHGHQECRE